MKTILEALYRGELQPDAAIIPNHPDYRPLARQVGEQTEQLHHLLDEDVFLELEEYLDLRDRVENMHMEASFQYGFRLGANLMMEVLNKRG